MFERKIGPALLMASLGALLACGGDASTPSPLAPHATSALERDVLGLPRIIASGRSVRAATCDTKLMANASAVFGPAGGTLLFGTSRLIIPGGALHDTVTVSATNPDGDNTRVEFQPHGLQFAKPAGLLLDTSGCTIDETLVPTIVYLGVLGEILEIIPAVYDPHWHTMAAPIEHFSGYAIAF